ncbi:hypothetical protein [Nocardioides sp.]|uniref:hypothetical protein n=1 Tax=Nocardioides sp. TaxID=35761 RepID=UPI001A2B39D2|nr:hypothetical protein [Nocardioides sp.]MBJ7356450.1 hypothetical protein [Nocardioides sp.]
MIRRLAVVVCLALAGPGVVLPADASHGRVSDPSPTAHVFLVLRKPLGEAPLGALFIRGTSVDGSRIDLGASVRLAGTPVSARSFEASAMRLRFVVRPVGGGDVSTGRASITFDSPYSFRPGITSLSLSRSELDQLFAAFGDRRSTAPASRRRGHPKEKPRRASLDGYVTHVGARKATGSGTLITALGPEITAAGGTLTLLGLRIDARTIKVDRLRLRFFGTHDGARRRGSLTIRLRQPEVVTRGLTQLFLNGAEAAQFYDAMATKLHQPRSRPAAPSTP